MGKNIFHRTDKNEIGIAAQVGTDRPFPTDDSHTAVAAGHRCGHDARGSDIYQLKV
jgi:hypothetical protein